jgi:hypothetical protein
MPPVSGLLISHQACHSERIERIQHNFVRYALRMLHWTADPADQRKVASALLIRSLLCDNKHLRSKLRFESNPYARRRNVKLLPYFHRTNYGRFEPLNNAIMNFIRYFDLFGFRTNESRDVFRDRLRLALSSEKQIIVCHAPLSPSPLALIWVPTYSLCS